MAQQERSAKNKPLLDLSTFVEREFILVDDKKYELRNVDELSLLDFTAFQVASKRVDAIRENLGGITEKDMNELRDLTNGSLRRIIVDLDESTIVALSDTQKSQIIMVFTNLLSSKIEQLKRGVRGIGDQDSNKTMIGDLPSLNSNVSMGETPKDGLKSH